MIFVENSDALAFLYSCSNEQKRARRWFLNYQNDDQLSIGVKKLNIDFIKFLLPSILMEILYNFTIQPLVFDIAKSTLL